MFVILYYYMMGVFSNFVWGVDYVFIYFLALAEFLCVDAPVFAQILWLIRNHYKI